jgi:hypothetical protein
MGCEILLEFHGAPPQLSKTVVKRDDGEIHICVRGKTAGAIRGAGSFQWTSAVQALSVLLLKTAIFPNDEPGQPTAILSGFGGSLASTLDYALSKQPIWTVEMLGVDGCGNSYLRRLILRTNPERKYPGPVIVTVNPRAVSSQAIEIWWDGRRLDTLEKKMRLASLLEHGEEITREMPSESTTNKIEATTLKPKIQGRTKKVGSIAA